MGLIAHIGKYLKEYRELKDVALLVNHLLAEGRSLFNTEIAACWFPDGSSESPVCFGSSELCEFFTSAHTNGSALVSSWNGTEACQLISSGENPAVSDINELLDIFPGDDYRSLVVFPMGNDRELKGRFAFLTHLDHLPDKLVEQGAFIARISELVISNSKLTDTVLSQSAEMGMLYETSASLSFQLETTSLLQSALQRGIQLLHAECGYIFHTDPDTNDPDLVTSRYDGKGQLIHCNETARGLAEKTFQADHPVLIHNVPLDQRDFHPSENMDVEQGLSVNAITCPISWDQEKIGTLVMLATQNWKTFSETDIAQIRLVAFQIANAMGIARLIDAEREQRQFAEALQSASVMIGQQIHLDEVLDTILEQARNAFQCDAANVMVIDAGRARIACARGYEEMGLDKETVEDFSLVIKNHANLLRMSEGEALYVPDIDAQDEWVVHTGFNWCKSWAGVPIIYNGALLGFLNLDSASRNSFSEQVLDQLRAFATHAAIALHKARLYERLTNEQIRLQQVYDVGRDISSSLDPELILDKLLSASLEVLGGVYGVIFTIPGDEDTLQIALKQNLEKLGNLHELYLVELLAKRIAHIQEPDCDYIAYTHESYWLLGLPLRTGKSILGVVMVWVPSANEFEQAWLDALATLGQQAALALTKADKHLELQRRLDELTILQHVSSAIARQLDFDAILKELTDQLHNKLGYETTQVFIREGENLILRQNSGPSPSESTYHISRGVIGRAARTGIPVLVPDVSIDPNYIHGIPDTVSELAVPILQDKRVIGVINVESAQSHILDESTRELLLMLADQVSIALRNAELYKQIRETVESLESRVQARTAVLEAVAMQAQEAERAKAQFVADVSHELRTPLTNIGLYLDLLEHGPDNRYHEYFNTMRRETDRLKGLIEQLLDISRLDAEQVDLQMDRVQVNHLLKSLVADRKMLAQQRGLDLVLKVEDNLPEVTADPHYLVQVMTNLLTNAMNYTPTGGKIRIASFKHSIQHRKGISFSIEDTGPGIPADEQAEIFNRFYRGTAGKNSGVSGTGLGLAISQEIIKQHHGTIILTSEPGSGTTFTVWLPLESSEG